MSLQLLVSRFQFMMSCSYRKPTIVALNSEADDYGVYSKNKLVANSFGTPLIARGTKEQVERLVAEVTS